MILWVCPDGTLDMSAHPHALDAVDPEEILNDHRIALDALDSILDLSAIESQRLLIPIFRAIALELQHLESPKHGLYFKQILHEALILAKAQETRLFLVDDAPSRQKRLEPRVRIIEILGKILPSVARNLRSFTIRTQLRGTPFHPELDSLGDWLDRSGLAIAEPTPSPLIQDRWLEGRLLGRILSPSLLEDLIDDSERLSALFALSLANQKEAPQGPPPVAQPGITPPEPPHVDDTDSLSIAPRPPKPQQRKKSLSPQPRPKDPVEFIAQIQDRRVQEASDPQDPFEQFFLKLIPYAGSVGCRWVQQRLWIPHPETAKQLGMDPQSMVEELSSLGVIEADHNNPYIKVRPYREQRGIYIRSEYSDRIRHLRAQRTQALG